jgi:hypothetical protein
MDNGVLPETKTLVELIRHYTSGAKCAYFPYFTPASDIAYSTKFENFPPFSLLLFLKIQMIFPSYINEINVENKTKTAKRHLEISKIYSSFMFAV